MKNFFRQFDDRYWAVDDAGGGGAATADEEARQDEGQGEEQTEEWVNPALRENLEKQTPQPQQGLTAEQIAEAIKRANVPPDEDEEAQRQAREAFKKEILADVMNPLGEALKPMHVSSLTEEICTNKDGTQLNAAAKAQVSKALSTMNPIVLAQARNNAELMENLRLIAEGAHSRGARKGVAAPASNGAGSSKGEAEFTGNADFEEWFRELGKPVLNLTRADGLKTYAEITGRK